MAALEKAVLVKIGSGHNAQEIPPRVPVQFNPASLRLSLSNQVEGGATRGRQTRQFNGKSSTELGFDLHFDTADEGSDESPQSVRDKTALVEQFVVPVNDSASNRRRITPPRVRFIWGDLTIDGVISALTIDFDLFAADGTPLRAKMGVSIREQDARYEIKQQQEASGPADPEPGEHGGAAPGSSGGGPGDATDRTGLALDGESAADFATRMGLDPSAWRGLAAQLDDPLSLSAGLEIDFNAGISASVGLGASVGFEGNLSASLEASLGLEVSSGAGLVLRGALDSETSAGFALAAAGGVSAALDTLGSARAAAAASASAAAFAASVTSRAPSLGANRASAVTGAKVRPPRADPRASTFGFGVPLRPLLVRAADERAGAVGAGGRISLRPGVRASDVPQTRAPGVSPWVQLPADDSARSRADAVQLGRRPLRLCGCRGPCRCRAGGSGCR